MADNFKPDPDNRGWFLGWAVVRDSPWDLVGFFDNAEQANTVAAKLNGYAVRYGSKKDGMDDFIEL